MNKKVESALNKQINIELNSSYAYLAMALHASHANYDGTASWMYKQAEEERAHAKKFCEFVLDRGGKVAFEKIEAPKNDFKSMSDIFENALKHEKFVTGSINKLYELAKLEKDYACESMLCWFIDEQVEEEKNVQTILDKIKMLGDKEVNLYLLDKELLNRKD